LEHAGSAELIGEIRKSQQRAASPATGVTMPAEIVAPRFRLYCDQFDSYQFPKGTDRVTIFTEFVSR
jgi:hypothetical protein